MSNVDVKKCVFRRNGKRMSFWVGEKHADLIDRASETLGFNRSEMARKLFLYLDRPKEDIIKMFGEEKLAT